MWAAFGPHSQIAGAKIAPPTKFVGGIALRRAGNTGRTWLRFLISLVSIRITWTEPQWSDGECHQVEDPCVAWFRLLAWFDETGPELSSRSKWYSQFPDNCISC